MLRWGIIAVGIVIIDQVSKWLVKSFLELGEVIAIIPGVNLQLIFNKGAAFGFLAQSSGWQRPFFIGLAVVVTISIIYWLIKLHKKDFLDGLALTSILGGALGNLIDRIYFGHVVDFIDVYYQDWHWYTFNIADSAICIGTTVLIFTLFQKR